MGKTTKAMALALETGHGVLAYDPNSNYRAWPQTATDDLEQFAEITSRQDTRVAVYRPSDPKAELAGFLAIASAHRPVTVIIDEAHYVQRPQQIDPELDAYIRAHERDSLDIILTLHTPTDVWTRAKSLATDFYFWRINWGVDLDYIAEHFSEEIAEKVSELKVYKTDGKLRGGDYLHIDVDSGTHVINTNLASWYVNISEPTRQPVPDWLGMEAICGR